MTEAKPRRSNRIAVGLLAAAAIVFLGLAKWQMDRAEHKRSEARSIAQGATQAPYELTGTEDRLQQYRRVNVSGHFESDGLIFVGPRKLGGAQGYYVVAPMRLAESERRVLVNRGWVAAENGEPPAVELDTGPQSIEGSVDHPSPPALVLADAEDRRAWGDTWPYLVVDDYAQTAPYPVMPMLVVEDPVQGSGYEQAWERKAPNPSMHIGYAIQWFAFAVIALGVAARMLLRGRKA